MIMETDKIKQRDVVDYFMWYLFNYWNRCEAIRIYGENLGNHIYEKWETCRIDGLDQLEWYANLDNQCREKLVTHAVMFMQEKKNKNG